MMNRRHFIKAGGAWSLGALFSGALRPLLARAETRPPVLVVVFMRGGVDQLSFLPPLEDRNYPKLRSKLAVPKSAVSRLKLDGPFYLHPRANDLHRLWKDRNLAFVVQAGLPVVTRSHSDAEAYLEFGVLGTPLPKEGVLFRAAELLRRKGPLGAVALQATTPQALMGDGSSVLTFDGLGQFELKLAGAPIEAAEFQALYASGSHESLGTAVGSAFRAMKDLAPIRNRDYARFHEKFPGTQLGNRMADIAWLIRNRPEIPLHVTELGNWDSHAAQGVMDGDFAAHVGELSGALAAFREHLGNDWGRTLVVAVTEFGRAAAENGCEGTDHGHGSLAIVAGGSVRGGRVLGSYRELKTEDLFDGRDLPVTTDSRLILAEALREHLRVPSLGSVFPGFPYDKRSRLGFV
jgi:uncharacterized protein (DUF1501 family)